MKTITKTEMMDGLTNCPSLFLGVTYTEPSDENLQKAYNVIQDMLYEGAKIKTRHGRRHSDGVKFDDGSFCQILGKNKTCYSAIYGQVLILQIDYDVEDIMEFEGIHSHKYLIYVIL